MQPGLRLEREHERGKVVSGEGTCEADSTSTGGGVSEIGIGANQIAWVVNLGGNTESSDSLYTSALPRPKEKALGSATRTGDVDSGKLTGGWIGGLAGDRDVLVVRSRGQVEAALS